MKKLFMGLPVAGQHFWGSFLVDGKRVVPIRQNQNDLAVRFLLFEGAEGEDLKLTGAAGFSGIAEVDREIHAGVCSSLAARNAGTGHQRGIAVVARRRRVRSVRSSSGRRVSVRHSRCRGACGYRVRYWTVEGTRDGHDLRGVVGPSRSMSARAAVGSPADTWPTSNKSGSVLSPSSMTA